MQKKIFVLLAAIITVYSAYPQNSGIISKDSSGKAFFEFEEITVTADKRIQKLEKVPGSVSISTENEIENNQVHSLRQLNGMIPNFFMPEYGSRLTAPVYIRGVGSRIGDPAVGLYIDDVPVFDKAGFDFEFFNHIKSIEVLRGPQGTLYGRNTMGGLIHIHTYEPSPAPLTHIKGNIGNYGYQKYQVSHARPIGNKMSIRVLGGYQQKNGFFNNDFLNKKIDHEKTFRGKADLLYQSGNHFQSRLKIDAEKSDEGGYPYAVNNDDLSLHPTPAFNHPSKYQRDKLIASLNNRLQKDYVTIHFVSSYQYLSDLQDIDQDFTPDSLLVVNQQREQHMISQEIRFASRKNDRIDWQGGIFGFMKPKKKNVKVDYEDDAVERFRLPGTMTKDKRYDFLNGGAALFGQINIQSIGGIPMDMIMGMRLDYEYDHLDYLYYSESNDSPKLVDEFQSHTSFLEWLPKISLKYSWNMNFMQYLSFSKGYKAGGFNSTFERDQDRSYQPEQSWNYEAGLRWHSSSHTYRAQMAVYYIDMTNQQVYQPVPSGQGSMIKNAARSFSYGIEGKVQASPYKDIIFSLSTGYTKARFKRFVRDAQNEIDYSNNHIPYVPEFTVGTDIDISLKKWFQIIKEPLVHLGYRQIGRHYWDEENQLQQNAYGFFNASLSGSYGKLGWRLWGKNILNTAYHAFCFEALGNIYTQEGKPLTFGASLEFIIN